MTESSRPVDEAPSVGPKIGKVTVSCYRIPTATPESDGTFEWEATTMVLVEATAAVLVLAATAVLVSQAPARETYGPAVTLDAPLGPDHVRVHVNTTRRGPQTLTIRVLDAAGTPVPVQTLTASLSSATVATLTLTVARAARDGTEWVSRNTVAPLPGAWTLQLNVGLTATIAYTTSTTYQVW